MTDHRANEVREPAIEYGERDAEPMPIQRLQTARSAVDRLKAKGRIRLAKGDLRQLGLPADEPHDISITEALNEQRAEG